MIDFRSNQTMGTGRRHKRMMEAGGIIISSSRGSFQPAAVEHTYIYDFSVDLQELCVCTLHSAHSYSDIFSS